MYDCRQFIRRPDSSIYVDAKLRAAKAAGMKTALVDIPTEGLSPTDLEAKVWSLWTELLHVKRAPGSRPPVGFAIARGHGNCLTRYTDKHLHTLLY